MTSNKLEEFIGELNPNDIIKGMYRRYGLWFGWAAMATITLANVATLMASTIIKVAIPDIMGTFGIGQDKAQCCLEISGITGVYHPMARPRPLLYAGQMKSFLNRLHSYCLVDDLRPALGLQRWQRQL